MEECSQWISGDLSYPRSFYDLVESNLDVSLSLVMSKNCLKIQQNLYSRNSIYSCHLDDMYFNLISTNDKLDFILKFSPIKLVTKDHLSLVVNDLLISDSDIIHPHPPYNALQEKFKTSFSTLYVHLVDSQIFSIIELVQNFIFSFEDSDNSLNLKEDLAIIDSTFELEFANISVMAELRDYLSCLFIAPVNKFVSSDSLWSFGLYLNISTYSKAETLAIFDFSAFIVQGENRLTFVPPETSEKSIVPPMFLQKRHLFAKAIRSNPLEFFSDSRIVIYLEFVINISIVNLVYEYLDLKKEFLKNNNSAVFDEFQRDINSKLTSIVKTKICNIVLYKIYGQLEAFHNFKVESQNFVLALDSTVSLDIDEIIIYRELDSSRLLVLKDVHSELSLSSHFMDLKVLSIFLFLKKSDRSVFDFCKSSFDRLISFSPGNHEKTLLQTILGFHKGELGPDPSFLVNPSNFWKLGNRKFQSSSEWKFLQKFRQLYQQLSLDETFEDFSNSTEAFEAIKTWRSWEIGNVEEIPFIKDLLNYSGEQKIEDQNFTRIKVYGSFEQIDIQVEDLPSLNVSKTSLSYAFLKKDLGHEIFGISSQASVSWHLKSWQMLGTITDIEFTYVLKCLSASFAEANFSVEQDQMCISKLELFDANVLWKSSIVAATLQNFNICKVNHQKLLKFFNQFDLNSDSGAEKIIDLKFSVFEKSKVSLDALEVEVDAFSLFLTENKIEAIIRNTMAVHKKCRFSIPSLLVVFSFSIHPTVILFCEDFESTICLEDMLSLTKLISAKENNNENLIDLSIFAVRSQISIYGHFIQSIIRNESFKFALAKDQFDIQSFSLIMSELGSLENAIISASVSLQSIMQKYSLQNVLFDIVALNLPLLFNEFYHWKDLIAFSTATPSPSSSQMFSFLIDFVKISVLFKTATTTLSAYKIKFDESGNGDCFIDSCNILAVERMLSFEESWIDIGKFCLNLKDSILAIEYVDTKFFERIPIMIDNLVSEFADITSYYRNIQSDDQESFNFMVEIGRGSLKLFSNSLLDSSTDSLLFPKASVNVCKSKSGFKVNASLSTFENSIGPLFLELFSCLKWPKKSVTPHADKSSKNIQIFVKIDPFSLRLTCAPYSKLDALITTKESLLYVHSDASGALKLFCSVNGLEICLKHAFSIENCLTIKLDELDCNYHFINNESIIYCLIDSIEADLNSRYASDIKLFSESWIKKSGLSKVRSNSVVKKKSNVKFCLNLRYFLINLHMGPLLGDFSMKFSSSIFSLFQNDIFTWSFVCRQIESNFMGRTCFFIQSLDTQLYYLSNNDVKKIKSSFGRNSLVVVSNDEYTGFFLMDSVKFGASASNELIIDIDVENISASACKETVPSVMQIVNKIILNFKETFQSSVKVISVEEATCLVLPYKIDIKILNVNLFVFQNGFDDTECLSTDISYVILDQSIEADDLFHSIDSLTKELIFQLGESKLVKIKIEESFKGKQSRSDNHEVCVSWYSFLKDFRKETRILHFPVSSTYFECQLDSPQVFYRCTCEFDNPIDITMNLSLYKYIQDTFTYFIAPLLSSQTAKDRDLFDFEEEIKTESFYSYEALAPLKLEPIIKIMGEATPKMEKILGWLGIHKDRFPQLIFEGVVLSIENMGESILNSFPK